MGFFVVFTSSKPSPIWVDEKKNGISLATGCKMTPFFVAEWDGLWHWVYHIHTEDLGI